MFYGKSTPLRLAAEFPGYYSAGDAGYMDANGYLHIMARPANTLFASRSVLAYTLNAIVQARVTLSLRVGALKSNLWAKATA